MVYAPDLVPEEPMAALIRRIEALERRLGEVASADVLATAGIRAQPGRFIVAGDLAIDGTLTAEQVIDNGALKSPVTFAGNSGKLQSTAPPGTLSLACSANLTVPDWAGFGVVMAVGSIAATTGAAGASLIGNIAIAGDVGDVVSRYVPANESETLPVLHQWTFDPSGTSVSVELWWRGSPAVFAGGSAYIAAIGVFGR